MSREDWFGLGVSLALHAVLFLMFAFITIGAAEEQQLGFVEVEFGPIVDGRPVQKTDVEQPPSEDTRQEPEPRPQPEPRAAAPKSAKPVDLPDQVMDSNEPEKVSTPDTPKVSPEKASNEADVRKPDPKPETRPVVPLGGGTPDGTAGASSGDQGSGAEEARTAPFQIEGLNRNPLQSPLPRYAEKVNATIKVRITVDPQGRVIRQLPLLKGNPALEQAVLDALQRWRFNALPPNAPQDNQTGVITFRFRLE